jgi:hypothetical protein
MRPIVFFPLVVIMYLAVPYCLYQYNYFSQIEAEQSKTQALVLSNNVQLQDQEKIAEDSTLYGEMDTVHNEKTGFLTAAVMLFIIPSLIIAFKSKLLKD